MTQGVLFVPTEEQRRTVRAMSGFGIPQEDIATFLEIDSKTLRKHFRQELDRGSIEATTKVAQSLFRMATDGGSVAAAIFWMKARAGWREKQPEGQPSEEHRCIPEMTDVERESLARRGNRHAHLLEHVSSEQVSAMLEKLRQSIATDAAYDGSEPRLIDGHADEA